MASTTAERRDSRHATLRPARAEPSPSGPRLYALLPWFGLALFAAVLLTVGPAQVFPDTWFGLDGAREILQHGFGDRNTWTRFGSHEWIDQQWAAHLGFYGVWRVGGAVALVLLNTFLVVTGLALCMRAAARRGGGAAWTTVVLAAVLVGTNTDLWFARAQSFSVLCFGLLAWLLTRDDGRLDREVFLVIPLIGVWTNLHAAVLVGAGICVVYAISCLVQSGPRARPLVRRALALSGGACLACLATPVVTGLPWYLRQTMDNPDFRRFLPEWHETTFSGSPIFMLGAFAAFAITACAPIARRDKLIVWLLTIAGFTAWRSELWACLSWLVVLPQALELLRPVSPGRWLRRGSIALALIAVLALVAGLAQAAYNGGSRFARAWPRPAAAIVESAVRQDPQLKVYADQPVSDWLLYEAPAVRGRLAIDGRFEVFDHRTFEEVDGLSRYPVRIAPRIAAEDMYVLSPRLGGDPRLIRVLEREPGVVVAYRSWAVVILRRT
jgi:hypothetical protein